jgi:hypothetical protein
MVRNPGAFKTPAAVTPEAGEELMRGYLDSLDPVSRWRAAQLRDVFSLAHVGDWGEEEDGSAAPVSPPRPSSGEDPFVIEVVSSHRSYQAQERFLQSDEVMTEDVEGQATQFLTE